MATTLSGRALFTISLGNDRFSTEAVIPALNAIRTRYQELVFFVADQIQLYNRAIRREDPEGIRSVLTRFYDRDAKDERKQWLIRIMASIAKPERFVRWSTWGFDDISDWRFARTRRNTTIAFNCVEEFRRDVIAAAERFTGQLSDDFRRQEAVRLSTEYILDEIAASIWLHSIEGIADEYYLASQLEPVVKLYSSHYSFSHRVLAGEEGQHNPVHLFFWCEDSPQKQWIEAVCPTRFCKEMP